jgi:hypothetical protein
MKQQTADRLRQLAQHLADLQAEVSDILNDQADQVEEHEPPIHPYQGALDYEFDRTYNGLLDPVDLATQKAQWITEVEAIKPITRETHTGGLAFWVRAGGLTLRSGQDAHKAFREIRRHWYDIAAERAKAEREAANWTGVNFLTSPEGKQKGPNGQYFGPFTRPQ